MYMTEFGQYFKLVNELLVQFNVLTELGQYCKLVNELFEQSNSVIPSGKLIPFNVVRFWKEILNLILNKNSN